MRQIEALDGLWRSSSGVRSACIVSSPSNGASEEEQEEQEDEEKEEKKREEREKEFFVGLGGSASSRLLLVGASRGIGAASRLGRRSAAPVPYRDDDAQTGRGRGRHHASEEDKASKPSEKDQRGYAALPGAGLKALRARLARAARKARPGAGIGFPSFDAAA